MLFRSWAPALPGKPLTTSEPDPPLSVELSSTEIMGVRYTVHCEEVDSVFPPRCPRKESDGRSIRPELALEFWRDPPAQAALGLLPHGDPGPAGRRSGDSHQWAGARHARVAG